MESHQLYDNQTLRKLSAKAIQPLIYEEACRSRHRILIRDEAWDRLAQCLHLRQSVQHLLDTTPHNLAEAILDLPIAVPDDRRQSLSELPKYHLIKVAATSPAKLEKIFFTIP